MTPKTVEPLQQAPLNWDPVPQLATKARSTLLNLGYDLVDLDSIKADILSGKLNIRSIRNYGKKTHEYICKQLGIPVYFHPRLVWSCKACGLQGKQSDFMHHPE